MFRLLIQQCGKRQLAKCEWKFRQASKIQFIFAGLASRNLKTLATINGLQLQNTIAPKQLNFLLTVSFIQQFINHCTR